MKIRYLQYWKRKEPIHKPILRFAVRIRTYHGRGSSWMIGANSVLPLLIAIARNPIEGFAVYVAIGIAAIMLGSRQVIYEAYNYEQQWLTQQNPILMDIHKKVIEK